jgi:hypothetical protein
MFGNPFPNPATLGDTGVVVAPGTGLDLVNYRLIVRAVLNTLLVEIYSFFGMTQLNEI